MEVRASARRNFHRGEDRVQTLACAARPTTSPKLKETRTGESAGATIKSPHFNLLFQLESQSRLGREDDGLLAGKRRTSCSSACSRGCANGSTLAAAEDPA